MIEKGEVYLLYKYIHYFQNSHRLLEQLRNQWNPNPDPVIYSAGFISHLVRGSPPGAKPAACPALPQSRTGRASPEATPLQFIGR